jgi:hypothetical protein
MVSSDFVIQQEIDVLGEILSEISLFGRIRETPWDELAALKHSFPGAFRGWGTEKSSWF